MKMLYKELKYFWNLSFYWLTKKRGEKEPLIRLQKEGLSPDYAKPVCFFCSFDRQSIVKAYVYFYLNALRAAGFDIVFISTSEIISSGDLGKLSRICIKIIHRENKGYDFYGWKIGLEQYPQHKYHTGVLLANDSVVGSLFDIRSIILQLENCNADVVGMTDCFRFYPHLQSYFLYCKKNVVLSAEFTQFFGKIGVLGFKAAIIRKYEIGFSRFLGHKFRIAPLYKLKDVVVKVGYKGNKSLKKLDPFFLWKPLIIEFKFPFLKKSLFVSKKIPDITDIPLIVSQHTTYSLDTLADSFPQVLNKEL